MKTVFAILSILFVFSASAETELTCWNIYSKKGSKPILKAGIQRGTTLTDVTFNLEDEVFSSYFIDKTEDAGELWGHKPKITKSELVNPEGKLKAEEITSNRSPYKGNNEYSFELGSYEFKSPYTNQKGSYTVRLILPPDLSNENLKTFRIRKASERSNAVMIYPPFYDSNQSGDDYLRMFCVSK